MSLAVVTHSADETAALGETLGALLRAGDVLLLQGPLGAGKTRLTQGLVRGAGGRAPVTSPTFVLVNVYPGPLTVNHVDLYRIDRPADADSLGLDDYFDGDGVTVVEWPDRAPAVLPPDHLLVLLDYAGDSDRSGAFHPSGARYQRLLDELAPRLGGHP